MEQKILATNQNSNQELRKQFGFEAIVRRLKQLFCKHEFYLRDLKTTGINDTDKRVSWKCYKCNKIYYAHCGLDITPKHGYVKSA